jgi:propanol-preferring alcohol dehydrogenase
MVLFSQEAIENRPLLLSEVSVPAYGNFDLLVKVSYCGVCRTDLHIVEGDLPLKTAPLIPGHQVVGTIVEKGNSCRRFNVGDCVGFGWLRFTCGNCAYCKSGRENLCENARYTGYHEQGGYAEFAVIPEAFAYPIPPGFSEALAAPLLCAGIIGYRALSRSHLPPKGKLGIFGFGSSAHIILQMALSRGCHVFVITRSKRHQEFALQLGADWAGSQVEALPKKLDSAIVFAPAGEVVPLALQSIDKGGTVVLAGIHMSDIPAMHYEEHLFHEKQLLSVESNTREDGMALLNEAAKISLKPHIQVFPLSEANEALIQLKQGKIDGTAVLKI